jgi:hypothetical protein
MKNVRSIPLIPLILFSFSFSFAARAEAQAPRRVDARQMMRIVEASFEDTVRAAREAGNGLDPRGARNRPFWSALDRAGLAIEDVGRALRGRDERFFQALERGSVALGELRVVWPRTGSEAAEVGHGIRILSASFRLLRGSYGAEHLRYRQGAGLTAPERERFQRIRTMHARLADRLEDLRRNAVARGDRAMAAEMSRLVAEAERIATAPVNLPSYLNALIVSDEIRGEWDANRYYAEPEERADWRAANDVVEDLYVDSEVGHVFAINLGSPGDWSHLDEEMEVGGNLGAAGAIQVFQPSEGEEPAIVESVEPLAESPIEMDENVVEDVEILEAEPDTEAILPEGEIFEEDIPDVEMKKVPEEKDDTPQAPPPIG